MLEDRQDEKRRIMKYTSTTKHAAKNKNGCNNILLTYHKVCLKDYTILSFLIQKPQPLTLTLYI